MERREKALSDARGCRRGSTAEGSEAREGREGGHVPTMVVGSIMRIRLKSRRGRSAYGCRFRQPDMTLAIEPPWVSWWVRG